jgi:hypothetical protein
MMSNLTQNDVGEENITNETKNKSMKIECENIISKKKWKRNCVKCKKDLYYSSKWMYDVATRENRLCHKCANFKKRRGKNVKCDFCKNDIYIMPDAFSNKFHFCSLECRNNFSKNNREYWKCPSKIWKKQGRVDDVKRKVKNRLRAIEILGGKCVKCRYNKCTGALDFHHKDPMEKDSAIKKIWCRKWETIETEIMKCVLLCANCHREHHWKEKHEMY